jgi:hypothetical protein
MLRIDHAFVAGAVDLVDLPLRAVAHEIIANDRVGRFGVGAGYDQRS